MLTGCLVAASCSIVSRKQASKAIIGEMQLLHVNFSLFTHVNNVLIIFRDPSSKEKLLSISEICRYSKAA
jgi:hypothetical protein